MYGLAIFIAMLIAFPFLFPEEFLFWSRKVRQWLRDDLRRRVNEREWAAMEHEFDDL